jgi:hypothetical protein
MIILPRQARDKCRESTRKRERDAFSYRPKNPAGREASDAAKSCPECGSRLALRESLRNFKAAPQGYYCDGCSAVRKGERLFFEEEPFSDLETIIILPRQARGKHSERLRKNLYICRRIRPIAARKTAATGISARRALAALLGVGST